MVHHIPGGYANTYLIGEKEGFIAVDVGTKLAAKRVAESIARKSNRSLDELKLITATHLHIDHIGGISALLQLCPRAEVHFHVHVDSYLTGKERLSIPPFSSWIKGLRPELISLKLHIRYMYQGIISQKAGIPFPMLRRIFFLDYKPRCDIQEGVQVPGFPGWTVIETPGHTPDSICFYKKKSGLLISGDTILNRSGSGEINSFYCSREKIKASLKKLSVQAVEHIYPGHGNPIRGVKNALAQVKPLNAG